MRKKLLTAAILSGALFMCGDLISNPTGAPNGVTGSPGDGGATCSQSGCHFGSATVQAGMITSNIPQTGYVGGQIYTITVTVTGSGNKGFEVSPQDSLGNILGTLIAGAGSQVNSGYITHLSQKSASTATWSFQWTAPSSGTGKVTFYGAFAISRQVTRKSSLVVNESTVGIVEKSVINNLSVYPNPIEDQFNVKFNLAKTGSVKISLYDMQGRNFGTLLNSKLTAGEQNLSLRTERLLQGHYLLQIESDGAISTQPVLFK